MYGIRQRSYFFHVSALKNLLLLTWTENQQGIPGHDYTLDAFPKTEKCDTVNYSRCGTKLQFKTVNHGEEI